MASLLSQKPVTLKMIADRLGVSVTTVTRAISGSPKTSAEMTRRVNEVAQSLGYVRNLDGVRLRTGRSYVIAVVLDFPADTEIGDPTLLGILQGVHQRCAGSDFSVRAVIAGSPEEEIDELKKLIKTRVADGVILDHTTPQDARVRMLLEAELPFVTFGRTELFTPHAYFDVDNEFAAWQGTNALIERGFKSIGILEGPTEFTYVSQRLAGYRRALREAGLAASQSLISNFVPRAEASRFETKKMLNTTDVDALVCTNEQVLLGARAGLRDLAPARIDTFGFAVRGDTSLGEYLGLPLITSFYSRLDVGRTLADMLLKHIDGVDVRDLQTLVKPELRHVIDAT